MKKQLHLNKAEQGYYLPYVIFITMIIFSVITTSIALYQNKVTTVTTMIDIIEMETLVQMTKTKFLNEKLYAENDHGEVTYDHPSGRVILTFTLINEEKVHLHLTILTKNELSYIKQFQVDI